MKKNHFLVLSGLFLMLLFKRSLLPVESNTVYLLTNIIGAVLMVFGLGNKKSSFNYVALGYIGLNIFVHTMINLPLFLYTLVFIFPMAATLFYLETNPIVSKHAILIKNMVKFSLILVIIAVFVLVTGFFLSFSLLFVATIVVLTQILLAFVLLFLLIHRIKLVQTNQ